MLRSVWSSDFARNLSWQYIANIGVGVLGAIYILLAAANLGAADFGRYTIVIAMPTIVFLVLDARMQEVYIYFHAQSKKRGGTSFLGNLFVIELVLRTISLLVALVIILLFGSFFLDPLGINAAMAASIYVFLAKTTNGIAMGMLRVENKLDLVAKTQLADWLTRIFTIGILLLIDEIDVINLVIGQALSGLFFNLFLLIMAIKAVYPGARKAELPGPPVAWRFFSSNRRIFLSNQATNASDSVAKELDVIILSLFVTLPSVGIYKLAKSCVAIIWRLGDPIFIVIMPKLAQLVAENSWAELASLLKKLTMGLFILSVIIYVAGLLGVWLVFNYIYPAGFEDVPIVFFWMAWTILTTLPLIWVHPLAASYGRPDLQMIASVAGNLIGLAIIAAGSAQYGAYGGAFGAASAMFLPMLFCALLLKSKGYLNAERP
jgi:O-antigen/teichoic acid export membrane protein